LSGLAPSGT